MTYARPLPHAMSPMPDFEEQARLDFALALKGVLRGSLRDKLPLVYENRAAPQWAEENGRRPQNWREAGNAMEQTDAYKWWSALGRAQQEFYVDITSTVCKRQLPDLIVRFQKFTSGESLGSLELNPGQTIPDYQNDVDIHCVPGSYFIELTENDVWSGARSDLGSFIFSMGKHGALNEDKGVAGAAYVKEHFPDLKVNRVLDLGCTVGLSTLPYCDAFPEAEIHALDLSAPSLRYGHARAEVLGKKVHFKQGNAEHTDYPDEHFDLIVSHILLHETSSEALPNIVAECWRLLKPGGVMLHVEVPVRRTEALDQFLTSWDVSYNNEPFWATLGEMDLIKPALQAGFNREDIFEDVVPTHNEKAGDWLGYGARKSGGR